MIQTIQNHNGTRLELISFRIGDQEFCVDIMSVREIRGWTPATPLPQSPSYVRGVINLRGAVLPIIDLASRMGLVMSEPSERHVIIVAKIQEQQVGLLVDAVCDIITVDSETIQQTPDLACDTVKTFVRGLLAMEGRMISLISLDYVIPSSGVETSAIDVGNLATIGQAA